MLCQYYTHTFKFFDGLTCKTTCIRCVISKITTFLNDCEPKYVPPILSMNYNHNNTIYDTIYNRKWETGVSWYKMLVGKQLPFPATMELNRCLLSSGDCIWRCIIHRHFNLLGRPTEEEPPFNHFSTFFHSTWFWSLDAVGQIET